MSDNDKKLRGRAPLTVVRGASGAASHVYFSQVVDPKTVDPDEIDRLVGENFLEWVVPDGIGWKLAEDGVSGEAGTPVTVSQPTIADPERDAILRDPGLVNEAAHKAAARTADGDTDKADAPRRGRPSADEKAKLVEQAVAVGMDRGEAEKASVADLRAALKQ